MAELLAADLFDQSTLERAGNETSEEDVSLKHLCAEIYARVSAFLQRRRPEADDDNDDDADVDAERIRRVQAQTQKSLEVIREGLGRYKINELSLSYNGGKDCLVVLILYLCALSTHQSEPLPHALQSVYIVPRHPFDQIDAFVRQSSQTYHLDLARYEAPMRSAFEAYLRDRPRVKAVLVGTRRTDPGGRHLTHFDRTDGGWPAFMRVHPVIDWRYDEIWTFLRLLQFPYCPLYDQGYTSLGGTTDTHPNPALRIRAGPPGGREDAAAGAAGEVSSYKPAYELQNELEERLGRV